MVILVGKTCSGKSSVAKYLQEKHNLPRIITYTTRPRRDNETNEYHFISDEMFEKLKSEDFFFETTSYNVASGETWKYGTSKESLRDDNCIIMNPDGLKKVRRLLEAENFDIIVIYLNVSEGVQWNRLRQRSSESSDEASRRIKQDKEDFKDISEFYDFSITTDDMSPEEIAWIIWQDIIWKRYFEKVDNKK